MDEMTLVAATKNKRKVEELSAVLKPFGLKVIGRDEAGIPDFDVEETGSTFEENALLKARAIYDVAGVAVIADDSGLMVDALDGAPGIYSARFAGDSGGTQKEPSPLCHPLCHSGGTQKEPSPLCHPLCHPLCQDEANNAKLLALLADVPDEKRTASFVSAIAMIIPGREEPIIVRGVCPGRIAREPAGLNGFGYDPLFMADINAGSGRTYAQLSSAEKNGVSHRAQALAKLVCVLAAEAAVSD